MNIYKKKLRKSFAIRAAVILLAVMTILSGCGTGALALTGSDSGTEQAASRSEMFTERDLSGDYDESGAVYVSLNGKTAETASSSSGVVISGSTVTITKEGTYILSGTLNDGQITVDVDDSAKVQIVLKDASVTSLTSAALYVKSADKVFITSAAGTVNKLANAGSFTAIDDSNIDAAVFARDDITFNGSGSLTIDSPAGHGIAGKDDVKFAGGTYTITAAGHGVQANDSVRVTGSDITITAGEKDGIHVSNDSEDASESYFYISDGSINIAAGDDGIHADGDILAEGGNVTVTKSYEGLEALHINIKGGNIDVTASDDGLNAAGGSNTGENTFGDDDWGGRGGFDDGGTDGSITISGGNVSITASGDGVDSNGSVEISGGCTVVQGPSWGDTSVLDYNSTGTVTGGVFIGTGGAGMAENFSSAENQCVITLSVGSQTAGSKVVVTDTSGNVLAEVTPELDFAVVYVSTPELVKGGTYTVSAGSYSETVELTDMIYSSVSGGMNGRGFGGSGRMDIAGNRENSIPGGYPEENTAKDEMGV